MNSLNLEQKFLTSINFLDDILFLDSFESDKKVYNMVVNYFKKDNYYLLKLNVIDNNKNIIDTECTLSNKVNGSIVISDIINLITDKYKSDLINKEKINNESENIKRLTKK